MSPLTPRKGQSTLEYAVLISVVVAALIAMQIYMKRGVQGKLRDATDQVGEQYAPGRVGSTYNTTTKSTRKETLEGGVNAGHSTSELVKRDETQTKEGEESVTFDPNEKTIFQ